MILRRNYLKVKYWVCTPNGEELLSCGNDCRALRQGVVATSLTLTLSCSEFSTKVESNPSAYYYLLAPSETIVYKLALLRSAMALCVLRDLVLCKFKPSEKIILNKLYLNSDVDIKIR